MYFFFWGAFICISMIIPFFFPVQKRQNQKSLRGAFDNGKMRAVVFSSGLEDFFHYAILILWVVPPPSNSHHQDPPGLLHF